jgi:hypothetical protein
MSQVAIPYSCSSCGKPLIEIEFSRHYTSVCNNGGCLIFRQPQGSRERNSGFISIAEIIPSVVPPPNNPHFFKKKRGKKGRVR